MQQEDFDATKHETSDSEISCLSIADSPITRRRKLDTNDLTRDHQQMKVELEGKKKELLENLNEQNKENNDIADQFELVNEQLKAEKEEKEQIMSELERYKVYLPEAEGLLQEVNNRHQGALDEIEQQQKIAA